LSFRRPVVVVASLLIPIQIQEPIRGQSLLTLNSSMFLLLVAVAVAVRVDGQTLGQELIVQVVQVAAAHPSLNTQLLRQVFRRLQLSLSQPEALAGLATTEIILNAMMARQAVILPLIRLPHMVAVVAAAGLILVLGVVVVLALAALGEAEGLAAAVPGLLVGLPVKTGR
jgi:hypothetical protein